MTATLAQFRAQCPAMATVSDAVVNTWLALTLPRVNPSLFGGRADTAQIWLTAHEISCEPPGLVTPAAVGASAVTVGPVSITYASAAHVLATNLASTIYGQRFEALAAVARLCSASLLMPAGEIL